MKHKYKVFYKVTSTEEVIVEAENKDEAVLKAIDESGCEFDIYDVEEVQVVY